VASIVCCVVECPEENAIVDFVRGALDAPARAAIETHLDACEACGRVVAELARVYDVSREGTDVAAGGQSTLGAWSPSQTSDEEPTPRRAILLQPGTRLGRYEVRERIGSGGMGVVFTAYDPELDRRIAIKILRDEKRDEGDLSRADEARRRLLREAQAMAKLDHPNVIKVHDVGLHEGRVFIAMEFVEGETLKAWLASGQRPWREVLDVFVQAGRGLAAAHGGGLVHRDFKPDNVMIDRRGHVRVMDFGLARAVDHGDSISTSDVQSLTSSLGDHLTRTGSLVGTPAYMAPEQHMGQPTDARTDQFSFCVALWEGVYGTRPFVADTMTALSVAVLEGRLTHPSNDRGVPWSLRRALERGLSLDPGARFASMDELLRALWRDPSASRRTWIPVAATATVAFVAVGAIELLGDAEEEPCSSGPAELERVWGDARRQEIAASFDATQLPYAPATLERVQSLLDAYGEAWVAMHREACVATADGVQSAELLDRRMACLSARLGQLDAWTRVLAEADAELVQRAVEATAHLDPIDQCADAEALEAEYAEPADPSIAARVDELRVQLDRVIALEAAGRWDDAIVEVEPLLDDVLALDYPPLQAEVRLRAGSLHEKKGNYARAELLLSDAYWQAAGIKHERVAAYAAGLMVLVVGHDLGRPKDTEIWERQGRAAVQRVGVGGNEEVELLGMLGVVAVDAGDYDKAIALHREALALRRANEGERTAGVGLSLQNLGAAQHRMGDYAGCLETQQEAHAILAEALGPRHPKTATPLMNLGAAAFSLGRLEEAQKHYLEALSIMDEGLGPTHARVADVLHNLSLVERRQGRYDDALEHAKRALTVFELALGEEHPRVGAALGNIGNIYYTQGEYADAQAQFDKALAQRLRSVGPDHPETAFCHENLGNVFYMLGDLPQARQHYERALQIRESALPKDHPDTALALHNLAGVLGEVGESDAARDQYARALTIRRATLPATHPRIASSLVGLGRALTDLDEPSEAVPAIEEALQIYGTGGDPGELSEAQFALARALYDRNRPGDRSRARQYAEEARRFLRSQQPTFARQLEQVEMWMAAR
jgi:serine/threonine protein kinase/tetratricopeptide (TPR) repeat protein